MNDDTTVKGTGIGGSLQGSLGSLTQSVHRKQLRSARQIFVIVGLLTVGVNVFGFLSSESIIDTELNKQVQDLQRQGMQVDPGKFQEIRLSTIRSAQVMSAGMIAVGVLYLIFAGTVQMYPVAITISGLVIYVAAAAAFGILDPTTLARGIILKVIIVISLVKAVQSAIAYEREARETAAAQS